jgi:DNA-binding CsgD family transcriptional regulator
VELPDQIAIPGPGILVLNRMYALAESGQLADAAELAAAAYDATPASAPPDALMWFAYQQGRCALLAGRLETARRWLGEALARCASYDVLGPRKLVLSALATAHAGCGDDQASAAAAAELDGLPAFPFCEAEQELGRAWCVAAAGDLPGARQVLLAGADLAAATGYRSTEAWLLHDVARLGEPAAVAERLRVLASVSEGRLVARYAEHAEAAAGGAPGPLEDASRGFEELGARLAAAEAAAEAAHASQRAGDGRRTAALAARSAALAASCEGARTPGLVAPVLVVALTARERDIAELAAQGQSSKDIAAHLFLSVRTVNNHLQSAYTKLGIASRRQLAGALGDSAP